MKIVIMHAQETKTRRDYSGGRLWRMEECTL